MPRTSSSWKSGESGNAAGPAPRDPTLSEALRSLARKQFPGAVRGTSYARQAAILLFKDATDPGQSIASARKRLLAAREIADRIEGVALTRTEVKSLVVQAQAELQKPWIAPWDDDSAPGVAYVSDAERALGDGRDGARVPSVPALESGVGVPASVIPPESVRSAGPGEGAVLHGTGTSSAPDPDSPRYQVRRQGLHGNGESADDQGKDPTVAMAAVLATIDPMGLLWNTMRAVKGLPPTCPPWLTQDTWSAPKVPLPLGQPVWGRPGAASLVQEPGEIVSGAEIMRRKGISPEVLPG